MAKIYTNTEEIEEDLKLNKDLILVPEQIKKILGVDPQSLRNQAREAPHLLGFPTICTGSSSVRIPAEPFVKFLRGELPPMANTTIIYNYSA